MPASEYIRRLRAAVGTEALLLPSVMVLPRDADGRVLLVRHADSGLWGTIGGTIEIDESPEDAGRREALEEAGVEVALGPVIAALGGPQYRVTYPNGDEAAYVAVVYEATSVGPEAIVGDDEVTEVGWFGIDELAGLDLGSFALAAFAALGWL